MGVDMIIVYGMGTYGQMFILDCEGKGIDNIVLTDSDKRKWGKRICGHVIVPPQEAFKDSYDYIIITTSENNAEIIKKDLMEKYKVQEEKILERSEVVVFRKDGIVNLGDIIINNPDKCRGIVSLDHFINMMDKSKLNDLEKLYFMNGHNLSSKWIHYFEAYHRFFSRFIGKDVSILEIGVAGGGSLQLWKKYFKRGCNAVKVFGIDIDPRCKQFEEDGIEILIGSQDDLQFLRSVKQIIGKIDILIDDGGHSCQQQINTFEELFDTVTDDGIYLCEDVHTSYMKEFMDNGTNTFIEYSKNLIDEMHHQYSDKKYNEVVNQIKSINYYDSMVFFEKRKKVTYSNDILIKR